MARVLLLGGTGAMGVYLRQILAERGNVVFVTSRSTRRSTNNIRFFQGDAHDLLFVKRVAEDAKPDVIIDFMVYYTEAFRRRVQTLLALSSHYLFLSSYRVFADSFPIVESSPRLLDVSEDVAYLQTDEYALAKARQEDVLRNSGKSNWTIIRPAITYSKDRFQFGVLEANVMCWRALHNLPVVMPDEMMDKQTTMTWGGDVARMIAGLAGNPLAMGDDFNCATAEHCSWRDIAEVYRQAIGLKVMPCSLDEYIVGTNKYQVVYDRMFNRILDNSKVLRVAGIEQSSLLPVAEGLLRELKEFKRNPQYRCFDLARNVRIDRLTGSRIPFMFLPKGSRMKYLELRYPFICGLPERVARKIMRGATGLFETKRSGLL